MDSKSKKDPKLTTRNLQKVKSEANFQSTRDKSIRAPEHLYEEAFRR